MEGTLSATGTTLLSTYKTLRPSIAAGHSQSPLLRSRRITTITNAAYQRLSEKLCSKSPLFDLRTPGASVSPVLCRLQCVSSSAASSSSPDAPLSSDLIVLDVGDMTCEGCASSVKRILENQAQVSSANVNLTTKTAIVWPVSEATVTPNWQKVVGEKLAEILTNCGFTSNLRDLIATTTMEVEVKLRLPDSAAHQKLSDVLSSYHTKTYLQQNLFFDTPSLYLATTHLAALRLRFYDLDSQAILSLKSKPTISAGISRIEEEEEPLDPSLARLCAAEPWRFSTIEKSRILKRVKEEFGVDWGKIVCLGGFRNVRSVHEWIGLKLELDETKYDFGFNYEVECESNRPDEAKLMIEDLLNRNGIRFSYSQVSKFAIFRSGKLPEIK